MYVIGCDMFYIYYIRDWNIFDFGLKILFWVVGMLIVGGE